MSIRTLVISILTAACVAAGADSTPRDRANAWLLGKVSDFRARAAGWKTASIGVSGERLKAELDTLRRAYKALEPAVETLRPGFLEAFNGAPLDRPDLGKPSLRAITKPQGLQVLEEEVYRDDPAPDRARIAKLLSKLVAASDRLADSLRAAPPGDAALWEAAELEVIRVLAMGLSGFDAPASGRGLIESGAALHALADFAFCYREALDRNSRGSFASLDARLRFAGRALEMAGDFDGFDRLDFLRRHGNPLHAALVDARRSLGLERSAGGRAVSPRAKGLFDPAFLDASFYAADTDGRSRQPASAAGADLGRQLFFDPILSADNRRACASCHRPENAYAEPLARSAGFRAHEAPAHGGKARPDRPDQPDQDGERNAPSLVYSAYQAAQFWDLRAGLIEDQIGEVVTGAKEFNTSFNAIEGKLRAIPGYVEAFGAAFPHAGKDPVDPSTVTSALAQYVRSLAGWNSSFDRYARGERDTLEPAAKRGFNLFMGKAACATCHFPPSFNGTVPPLYRETESEVLGVPATGDTLKPVLDADPGRYRVRAAPVWQGAFKTPTVRNAALSAPFMHNGALADLEAVVRFYDRGGGAGMGLDVPNQTLPPDSLGLSAQERGDLVAFMKSLTDDPLKVDGPGILPQAPLRPDLAARPPGGEY